MPENLYKPVISKENNNFLSSINDAWKENNPKKHQCLKLNNYLIVRCKASEDVNQVSVTSEKREKTKKKKDAIKDFPEELRATIKSLQEECDLTQTQIRQLKKELKNKELKKLDLEKQIAFLKNKAGILQNEKRRKKIKDDFVRKYKAFFACLDPELKDLDPDSKEELRDMLNNMTGAITDALAYLDNNKNENSFGNS